MSGFLLAINLLCLFLYDSQILIAPSFFVQQKVFLIKKVLSCGMKTHFNIDKLGFGDEKEEFIVVVF